MPSKRSSSRSFAVRKKKGKKARKAAFRLSRAMLGTSQRSTLRYATNIQLNPGLGDVPATWTFAANGLFDPDITGVGHQPLGFDQMMTFFHNYTVLNCRIRVNIHNADVNYPQIWGIAADGDSAPPTSAQQYIEQGEMVYSMTSPLGDGQTVGELSKMVSIKGFSGKDPRNDMDWSGDSTSNPNDIVYLHVFTSTIQSVDGAAQTLQVLLEYDTLFSEPKTVPQS